MPVLSREQIRAASQRAGKTVDVPVPLLGEGASIRLRQLRGGEAVQYQQLVKKRIADGTEEELIFDILQRCAVDEHGAQMWDGAEGLEDIRALPGGVLKDLAEAASKLNDLSDESVEDAAKN